jgi:hypothetical protein
VNRPSPWFERQQPQPARDERLMRWSQPTWVERHGELIATLLGVVAMGAAVVATVVGATGGAW